MLIPRKEKGQLEIYKCKLGIHDWVTEHWWETRQTTSISNLDVEDLKRIRKVIRKAIRDHENNKSI